MGAPGQDADAIEHERGGFCMRLGLVYEQVQDVLRQDAEVDRARQHWGRHYPSEDIC
jgi:hypothetical protein